MLTVAGFCVSWCRQSTNTRDDAGAGAAGVAGAAGRVEDGTSDRHALRHVPVKIRGQSDHGNGTASWRPRSWSMKISRIRRSATFSLANLHASSSELEQSRERSTG